MNVRALRTLFVGAVINRAGAFVFPYLTLYFHEQRGVAMESVGILLAVGACGLLVGNLCGGWAADRFRPKPVLVAALLTNTAGFAWLSRAGIADWGYALILFGAYEGTGMFGPAANTLVADLTPPERRARAYTSLYVCGNLGMALGPLLGGILASIAYSWLFIGDIISSVTCAILILAFVPALAHRRAESREERPESLLSAARRHPQVLAFSLGYFFLIAPLMAMEFAVPLYVKTVFGSTETWVGLIYTINAVTILSASHAIERRLKLKRPFRLMALAAAIWCLGLGAFAAGFRLELLVAVTVVWTLGEIVASVVAPTYVSRNVPDGCKGRFLSIQDAMRSLASIVCPLALGAMWANTSPRVIAIVIFAIPLAGVVAYLWLGMRTQKETEPAAPLAASGEPA